MTLRSAHQAGVTPSVSLTCRNSMNIVFVSSTGTIPRLMNGPLNGCSPWPSSQIGATCCRLGSTASTASTHRGHSAGRRPWPFRPAAKVDGERNLWCRPGCRELSHEPEAQDETANAADGHAQHQPKPGVASFE